jgi:hypothetical protein
MILLVEEKELAKQPRIDHTWQEKNWGSYSGYSATGVGFMVRLNQYNITKEVIFCSKPLQPILTLHIQIAGEAYCSLGKSAEKLLPDGKCTLFVQAESPFTEHLLPGIHTHFDFYYNAKWLAKHSRQLPDLDDYVKKLKAGMTDIFWNETAMEGNKETETLLQSIVDHMQVEKPSTSFLDDKVALLLQSML